MQKTACPACRERGDDTAGDNLTLYWNKTAHCHACGYHLQDYTKDDDPLSRAILGHKGDGVQQSKQYREQYRDSNSTNPELELELIQSYPIAALPHKQICQAVAEAYGVRYSTDGSGDPDAVYYPYYADAQIVDYKKRILPKRFVAITGKVARADLFGQQRASKRRGLLVITEGEDDAMAATEMLWYLGKDYLAVSLQNGANAPDGKGNVRLDAAALKSLEFICTFKHVILCLDNDKAGKAYAEALAEKIAPQTRVSLMQLPEGVKDAYDAKAAGLYNEFYGWLNNAKEYTPEGIMEGREVTLADLQEAMQPGYAIPYPGLQSRLHGLRKGEITLVTAGTGQGKTSLCRELAVDLVKSHGLKVGNIFLEEQWRKTGQGYIAIDNDVPLPQLRLNPDVLTPEQWQASYDRFFGSNAVHFFKHFGSVASEKLIQKCRYMALALECDFIILDHVTMVMSGNETADERKDIDVLMTRLAELVTETGVGIIPVVHLKRVQGKSFNHGDEVEITDLRGSSQLEALSFNIIAIERDQQSDGTNNIMTLRVLKNREWGFTGYAGKIAYQPATGRLVPLGAESTGL